MQVGQTELNEYLKSDRVKLWIFMMLAGSWLQFWMMVLLAGLLPSNSLLFTHRYIRMMPDLVGIMTVVVVTGYIGFKREKSVKDFVENNGHLPRPAISSAHWIALVLAYVLGFIGFCIWVVSSIHPA